MNLIPKAELQTTVSSPGVHGVANICNRCISEEKDVREISTEGILEVKKGWRRGEERWEIK